MNIMEAAETETTNERELIFLTFRVGPVQMAVPVQRLREVLRYRAARPVPYSPPFIDGIINLRGELIPVLDLRKRFNYSVAITRKTRILLTWVYGQIMGLVVDEAETILHTRVSLIRSVPSIPDTALEELIIGAVLPEDNSDDVSFLPDFNMLLKPSERRAWQQWTPVTEPPSTTITDEDKASAQKTPTTGRHTPRQR